MKGVLDKGGVLMAKTSNYLDGTHVVVATPAAFAEVAAPPQPQRCLDHAKFLVVDEVDACFKVCARSWSTRALNPERCEPYTLADLSAAWTTPSF